MLSSSSRRYLEGRGAAFWLLAGCLLVSLFALIDIRTGPELSVSLFYLIPVVLVTWFCGRKIGIGFSVIAAMAWFAADLLSGSTYSQPLISYWNAAIRFGFFLVVALLIPALKELEREKELSRMDHLTETSNRRHLLEVAQSQLFQAQQTQQPLSAAYIDVDGFKHVNDQHGHAAGDKLLRVLVARIRNHLRAADVLARVGGDEFVLLLPETDDEAARFIIRGIQSAIRGEMRQHNWSVGFSIGVVTYVGGPADVDDLLKRADELMYSAKRSGTNSIEHGVYDETPIPAPHVPQASIGRSPTSIR